MDNYKIKVNDEAESKEAQELFFELGYEWRDSKRDITNLDVVFIYAKDGVLTAGFNDHNFAEAGHKELTLPQLRDLVVLKRNDVKDANNTNLDNGMYFLSSDNVIYRWEGKWVRSILNDSEDYNLIIQHGLNPIEKPQDPALISGADALRALADGKDVEGFSEENEEWIPIVYFTVQEVVNGLYKFRLKPQTIKLELELPKPFEPEEDCHVYILDDGKTDGYCRYSYEVHGDKGNTFIGIWRTEEEIKQVVEQLRKIRGTNS
ncbi:hypothetical protein [Acinetobacter nosocomialis]|uniref:hypothetical protein n=1 Tax=Acinetobacter nosocomialis TaxID=106654 RepID=UPI00111F8278|nr:hypothetical protein [Acinetobacter nosocomialis]